MTCFRAFCEEAFAHHYFPSLQPKHQNIWHNFLSLSGNLYLLILSVIASLTWVHALVAEDDHDHDHDHKVQNETEAAGDEARIEIEKRIVLENMKEEGKNKSLQFWIWDNNNCYTFQLKYVFWLEESISLVMDQESITPKGNNNLNFWLAQDQVVLLKPRQIYCASGHKANDFFTVFSLF